MNTEIIKFFLFGDSICFGQLVSSHLTWATAFAKAVESLKTDDRKYVVQNAGVNGDTTRQGLERMHHDVTSHSPSYALVQFGMNDCNYWEDDLGMPRVSQKAFVANLEEIVEKFINAGTRHCFLNTNHPSQKGSFSHISNITYDESNADYNQLIRVTYDNLKKGGFPITMIDNEMIWKGHLKRDQTKKLQDYLFEDGIHLSFAGHELYRENLVPQIIKILKSIENL
jgi:lysophospholipase L1-like esterase